MSGCYNCGKPPIYEMPIENGKVLLCLDCYTKVHAIQQQQLASNINHMNYLTEMMEATVGIHGVLPRYHVPTPIQVKQGNLTFHNINVDNSTIGAINTGEVHNIDVAIDQIVDQDVKKQLSQFTESVLRSTELADGKQNAIIEQLSFLMSEMKKQKNERKNTMIGRLLENITAEVAGSALVSTWIQLLPVLKQLLG